MRVLVLYGKSQSANGVELAETAERLGHDVTVGSILDISSEVGQEGSRFWLKNEEIPKQFKKLMEMKDRQKGQGQRFGGQQQGSQRGQWGSRQKGGWGRF